MANETTRAQITAENQSFYDRNLLERAFPALVHLRWGQVRDIPRNGGTDTIKFRRYGNLAVASTPLSEGITPAGSQLSITDVTAQVLQYGDFVTITDVLDFQSVDPVLMEAGEILGDQSGETLDNLTRDVLAAGTQVYFGGNATERGNVDSTDLINDTVIKKVCRFLKKGNAKRITRMVNPSTGYSTTPINAAFIGIVSPDTTYDLKGVTGWVPVEKYPNKSDVMENEVGAVDEVRFVETTDAKVFTGAGNGGIDVHATIVLAANAYGYTRISGEALKNIIKPLGSAGTADPLEQRATSGWKATFVAKILNNAFLCRIEHAVTA